MQELEIEKRYLIPVDSIVSLKSQADANSATYMNDFYVPNGDRHKDLRLRQKGDKYMITRKTPVQNDDSTTMLETTIPLSVEEFTALSDSISTNVEKTRYQMQLDDWKGELDIFSGRHEGLAVLEFEFPNEAELKRFIATTSWDFPDITNLEWLASGRLAETSYADLAERLATLA